MPSQFTLYQIDAFTEKLFSGNPAAIIPLDDWCPDELLQQIATENNLSETAYFIPADNIATDGGYNLRWFTPVAEVDLCGHATLAAAFVIFTELVTDTDIVRFDSRSGPLTVRRIGDQLCMDFPAIVTDAIETPTGLAEALGCEIKSAGIARGLDYVIEVESESTIRHLRPDFHALRAFDKARGIIVTSAGKSCDFVSRFFAPNLGVDEDPVTGSAHCALAPYWSERLSKTELKAQQLSARGGNVECRVTGDRVELIGSAVKYLEGQIRIA